MLKYAIAGACLFLSVGSALAQEVRLVGLGGGDTVFIWTSKDAHNEAMSLIQAGVHKSNPILVARLLACTVASGTRAIITDAGFVTQDVMVIDGPEAGCRGNVPTESVD